MEESYKPYDPLDTNHDGIVSEIERYAAEMRKPVHQRRQEWIEKELHPKGMSADLEMGTVHDHLGAEVGKLPSFE